MADQTPDPDSFTAPTMLTKSMRRDVYPAVDPTNPELSAKGKVVAITGVTGGIGLAIAKAWHTAGASGIVLVGRSSSSLEKVASSLGPNTLVAPAKISSAAEATSAIGAAVKKFGKVDVLVNSAGRMNQDSKIGEIDPDAWWEDFEVNLRGFYNISHAFIKATGGNGTIINLTSLGAQLLFPGLSSYSGSKLAALKLAEGIDLELPNIRVFSVHPGIVEVADGRGMDVPFFAPFAKDKPLLTGGLTLYLSTPKAEFLRGGFVSVNWDVEELEAHKDEITEKKLIKLAFLNGELQVGGYPWTGEK